MGRFRRKYSYVHDLDSDRTFTIGAEFEYGSGSRGKPYTNSPPHP
jgi:hypothetical protein